MTNTHTRTAPYTLPCYSKYDDNEHKHNENICNPVRSGIYLNMTGGSMY